MTASWGRRRRILGKNVVTCYIRPQRYTKEFVDANDTFTLSFYGPECKTPSISAALSPAGTATKYQRQALPVFYGGNRI